MNGTRPTLKLLSVAAALAIGAACTNSGLRDQVAPTDTGPTTNLAGGNPGNTNCEFVGTWAVAHAWCGNFEIDTDWFAVYPNTTIVVTDTGAGDGSCDVAFSWSNAQCAEEEAWEITASAAQSLSIDHGGIATCAPDSCTFFASDDSCQVGGRASGGPVDYDLQRLQATQIRIVGLLANGYPQCTLDLTTEWTKQ